MLDKESLEAYRSVSLHRDLRPEILARHTERHCFSPQRFLRPAAALASLLLVASVSLHVASRSGEGVYLDGSRISSRDKAVITETVSYTAGIMRAFVLPGENEAQPLEIAEGCIPLTMQFGQDVCVTVSGGVLLLPNADNVPTFAGQSGFAPDAGTIYWIPDGSESLSPLTAEFYDTEGNPLAALTLTYDAEEAQWHIASEKIKTKS